MCDGGFTYHARGVLIEDESAHPIANVKLSLSLRDWDYDINLRWRDEYAVATDSSGWFEQQCNTGLSWSQTLLFGFIPLARCGQVPTPPPLKEIFIMVRDDEQWRYLRWPLSPDQQSRTGPAERWIDVGTVRIRPACLKPLKIRSFQTREIMPNPTTKPASK
jgi:hypothetical protein